jgi:hypothetical protein
VSNPDACRIMAGQPTGWAHSRPAALPSSPCSFGVLVRRVVFDTALLGFCQGPHQRVQNRASTINLVRTERHSANSEVAAAAEPLAQLADVM